MSGRREFLKSAGFLGLASLSKSLSAQPWSECYGAPPNPGFPDVSSQVETGATALENGIHAFDAKAFAALPIEESYTFSKDLAKGLDPELGSLDPAAKPTSEEMVIPAGGWALVIPSGSGAPLKTAAQKFLSYLKTAMQTQINVEERPSLADWSASERAILVGTQDQLPGCGGALRQSKDYQIIVTAKRVVVCGYDEAGAMYGLYNLQERFSLREAPILPRDLNTVRHSLYKARMTLSGLGWMEWPDEYLAMLPRYGFDSIYASGYANPNGAPGGAPSYEEIYSVRLQDPAAMHSLIRRAARYGIKVYCPIVYNYTGTSESKTGLQTLVRDIVTKFPEIRGYVLLTEGFDTATEPPWKGTDSALREWVKPWAEAVRVVTEECHNLNPAIEVLPWDCNINYRHVAVKKFVIDQLPRETIPLVAFENGTVTTFDGELGLIKDYSISQIGPSEAAAAQIAEAKKCGMRSIYAKADTWATWQFGTFPYLPFPYQWYARYQALEKYGIDGTMESWSYGFKPNFVAEMRCWYSWSDAPPLDDLLRSMARRKFGRGSEGLVLSAWKYFSAAIRLDPDTGPSAGGNNAVANPLFFEQPKEHIMTYEHSWTDQKAWSARAHLNPHWPYVHQGYFDGYILYPDFSNHVNVAEQYVKPFTLTVFTKYLLKAADEMEKGLRSYRQAAMNAPASKRRHAFREVLLAEQIERMLRSNAAMLEFENLRFHLAKSDSPSDQRQALRRMTEILKQEIPRTQAALETAKRDSRLGYEWEEDYIYWPQTIELKLNLLHQTLEKQIPDYRRQRGLG